VTRRSVGVLRGPARPRRRVARKRPPRPRRSERRQADAGRARFASRGSRIFDVARDSSAWPPRRGCGAGATVDLMPGIARSGRGATRAVSGARGASRRGGRHGDAVSRRGARASRPAGGAPPPPGILTAPMKARIHPEDLKFFRCVPFDIDQCCACGGGADPARPPPLEGHEETSRRRAARRL